MNTTQTETILQTSSDKIDPIKTQPSWIKTQMPGGPLASPLYIVTNAKDIDEIDQIESDFYYILGALEESSSSGSGSFKKTTTSSSISLFKRIRKLDGNGIIRVTDAKALGLSAVEEHAFFSLPPMPRDFIDRIEYFFRKVDDDFPGGSEAIIILGFDRRFIGAENESDGWVSMVPNQENNSTHCKYEHSSVLDNKPDDVMIIGSIHSHPNMSAYASHTDAGDQVGFDGLHITIGWKGSITEYHCEFQIGNKRFDIDEHHCFEGYPKSSYDVDDWMKKVTRQQLGNLHTAGIGGTTTKTTHTKTDSSSPSSRIAGEWYRAKHDENRPKKCPSILNNVVIVTIDDNETDCPVCYKPFDKFSERNRRCTNCFTYIDYKSSNGDLTQIVKERKTVYNGMDYAPGLECLIDEKFQSKQTILLWDPNPENEKDAIRCVYTPKNGILYDPLGKSKAMK